MYFTKATSPLFIVLMKYYSPAQNIFLKSIQKSSVFAPIIGLIDILLNFVLLVTMNPLKVDDLAEERFPHLVLNGHRLM